MVLILPTAPLVNTEASIQGGINKHAALFWIQDPWSLPIPTNITSLSNSHKQSPLQSWDHASPVISPNEPSLLRQPSFWRPTQRLPRLQHQHQKLTSTPSSMRSSKQTSWPTPHQSRNIRLPPPMRRHSLSLWEDTIPQTNSSWRTGIETCTPSPSSKHSSMPSSRAHLSRPSP